MDGFTSSELRDRFLREQAISNKKKLSEVYRAGVRNQKSGYWEVVLGDGTVIVNSNKVTNSNIKPGEVVSLSKTGLLTAIDKKTAVAPQPESPVSSKQKNCNVAINDKCKNQGYFNGQIFTIPEEDRVTYREIKYLYTVETRIENSIYLQYYVGGHQPEPVLARSLRIYDIDQDENQIPTDIFTLTDRSFLLLDNLGKDKFGINLIYRIDFDSTSKIYVEYRRETEQDSTILELSADPQTGNIPTLNGILGVGFWYKLFCLGHSFWIQYEYNPIVESTTYVDYGYVNPFYLYKSQVFIKDRTLIARKFYDVGRISLYGIYDNPQAILPLEQLNYSQFLRTGGESGGYLEKRIHLPLRINARGTKGVGRYMTSPVHSPYDDPIYKPAFYKPNSISIANLDYNFDDKYVDINKNVSIIERSQFPIQFQFLSDNFDNFTEQITVQVQIFNEKFNRIGTKEVKVFPPKFPQNYTKPKFRNASYFETF